MIKHYSLVLRKGLIIILGCSHLGNIINYAIKKTGQEHINTIY